LEEYAPLETTPGEMTTPVSDALHLTSRMPPCATGTW